MLCKHSRAFPKDKVLCFSTAACFTPCDACILPTAGKSQKNARLRRRVSRSAVRSVGRGVCAVGAQRRAAAGCLAGLASGRLRAGTRGAKTSKSAGI
eukprot:2924643-Pleurochrysis_carterae.AAC.4